MKDVAAVERRADANASAGKVALATEGRTAASQVQSPRSSAGSAKEAPRLKPLDFPYETKLSIKAVVLHPCVQPGGDVTVSVLAPPDGGIAYQAIYADGKGGSPPPFGAGYGGNDKGYISDAGRYESSWTVSLAAPAGPARVDVIVGHNGKWGYADPHFAIADSEGNCPADWIREHP
jgi:hypothetical protein